MTYGVLCTIIWAAGAVAMLIWMVINEWPTRRKDAAEEGFPNHDAFLAPLFVLTACLWFVLPVVRYMERRQRG